jgi:hypothetical protein
MEGKSWIGETPIINQLVPMLSSSCVLLNSLEIRLPGHLSEAVGAVNLE